MVGIGILIILIMAIVLKVPIQRNIKKINEIVSKKNAILIEVLNNIGIIRKFFW